MLRLIAYDISCPKRLRRVAELCLDHGVRIQKSIFECWLDEESFTVFWDRLTALLDTDTDSLIAYTLDARAARQRRRAGQGITTEKRLYYVF
jgi:CRISPR-associated protein Cas2